MRRRAYRNRITDPSPHTLDGFTWRLSVWAEDSPYNLGVVAADPYLAPPLGVDVLGNGFTAANWNTNGATVLAQVMGQTLTGGMLRMWQLRSNNPTKYANPDAAANLASAESLASAAVFITARTVGATGSFPVSVLGQSANDRPVVVENNGTNWRIRNRQATSIHTSVVASDGNWHTFIVNCQNAATGVCRLYLDNVSVCSGTIIGAGNFQEAAIQSQTGTGTVGADIVHIGYVSGLATVGQRAAYQAWAHAVYGQIGVPA